MENKTYTLSYRLSESFVNNLTNNNEKPLSVRAIINKINNSESMCDTRIKIIPITLKDGIERVMLEWDGDELFEIDGDSDVNGLFTFLSSKHMWTIISMLYHEEIIQLVK